MGRVPEGGVLREDRIRMRRELGFECRMVGGRDGGLGTRWGARAQVLAAALFDQPAFEAAGADGEGGEHLLARHATCDRCQHAFSKVKRVTTHTTEYRIRSRLMPAAVGSAQHDEPLAEHTRHSTARVVRHPTCRVGLGVSARNQDYPRMLLPGCSVASAVLSGPFDCCR